MAGVRGNTGDTPLIPEAKQSKLTLSETADPKRKSQLGQFFTPVTIARFVADLFTQKANAQCRLLDAGTGIGSLSLLPFWIDGFPVVPILGV